MLIVASSNTHALLNTLTRHPEKNQEINKQTHLKKINVLRRFGIGAR